MSMQAPWSADATDPSQDQPSMHQSLQQQQQQQPQHPLHSSQPSYIDNARQTSLRPLQPHPYLQQPMPLAPALYPAEQQQQPAFAPPAPSAAAPLMAAASKDRQDVKRMRISRACDGCRRKKIKCDATARDHACKNCNAANKECTFNDSAKKRGPPKGYIEVLENRLKRMERILGGLADGEENDTQRSTSTSTSSSGNENDNHNSSDGDQHPSASAGTRPTPVPEKASSSGAGAEERISGLSSLSTSGSTRYVGDMSPLPFLAQKINFEDSRLSSHIGFKVRKFGQSLIMYKEDDDRNGNTRLLEHLGMLKPGETINSLNHWIYKVAGIDKATSDRLMKVYFCYIHPGLPIINKVLFLKQYRRQLGDYPSAALLNSMYGAAARYIETCRVFGEKVLPEVDDMDITKGWSENLFDNLLTYLTGRYTPCVSSVQALVISQFHRASLDEKLASGWLLNSAAVRTAQDLGLHRSSDKWDIPESEKETRRRVWWSVYILDKWSSAATGRPQTIFDEDCDEVYPSESASVQEIMDTPSSEDDGHEVRFPSLDRNIAQKVKGDTIPIYQPFVQLVKLSEILGRILQGLYTPRAKRHSAEHGCDAIVTYLDNTLSEWRANLPPSLQISNTNVRRLDSRGQLPLLSMSGLMYLTYCTLLILLHRPFIEKKQDGTRLSVSSLTICTNAATRCVDIAEKMHYRDFLLVSWNFALYPIFTASLIHVYNAGSGDTIVADVAKSNLVRSMGVIRRLAKLSLGACRLHEVLKKLMETRNITVDEDSISDNELDQHGAQKQKRKKRTGKAVARTAAPPSLSVGPNTPADMAVGATLPAAEPDDGFHTDARISADASAPPPPPSQSSDGDRASSGGSTPTSFINGEWINGLCSSIEPASLAPGAGISGSDNDVHSLRQFGLPMESMFPTIEPAEAQAQQQQQQQQQHEQQQQQQQQHQQQMAGSMMLQLNSADSFLFGIPDFGFTMGQLQQLQQQPMPLYSSSLFATQAPDTTTAATATAPAAATNGTPYENHFRNRPDNPFWSVPSSLELDDWTAYLLPQQQQQQQQQQPGATPWDI